MKKSNVFKKILHDKQNPQLFQTMVNMKILDLPLKAKWYEMIESGNKKEEYREICDIANEVQIYALKVKWQKFMQQVAGEILFNKKL